mmetsp:Transcript_41696/g.110126  ORF Transcript_41696/g.110126 Transcript_41696/m.110126 type:complete len:300 (+) Transcript_41696:884-1783(+)
MGKEGRQNLAHPPDLIHGLLVEENLLEVAFLDEQFPISVTELGHCPTECELPLLHRLHVDLRDPVVHAALGVAAVPLHVQVVPELDDADDKPHERPQVLVIRLVSDGVVELPGRDALRFRHLVHLESGPLDDDVPRQRAQHHLGARLDVGAVADARLQEAQAPRRVQLRPGLGVCIGGPLVHRAALLDVHTAEENGQEPRQREQHNRAARERPDADGDLVLCIIAQAGEENHHAVGNSAQDGHHEASHHRGILRHQEQKLAPVADQLRGLKEHIRVHAGQEQDLREVAELRIREWTDPR